MRTREIELRMTGGTGAETTLKLRYSNAKQAARDVHTLYREALRCLSDDDADNADVRPEV